jgi:hypothetical protein
MAVVDPYRTLGLSPGASLDEVKAAYRRLAKRYHPDSAGPAAISRFLEVQLAYEMLTTGRIVRATARPRPSQRTRPSPSGGRAAGPGSSTGSSSQRSRPRSGSGPASAGRTERPRDDGARAERPRTERARSGRRKATLGSTSYDEAAAGPLDADWRGASWYGTDSGTYWTVNPREYADPRKHGPEYQERARRAAMEADPPAGGQERAGGSTRYAPPTWTAARPVTEPAAGGPGYPGILTLGIAAFGLIVGLVTIFALFAKP